MNEGNGTPSVSTDFCTSFSNEEMVTLNASLASDAKLQILSGWMSVFDSRARSSLHEVFKNERNKNSMLNFLKSCLTVGQNRYVAYTARKVITSLIKIDRSEDGIQLVQEILDVNDNLELICTGLQICRELFSRKTLEHEVMVSKLGRSVTRAWQVMFEECATKLAYNQFLMEYFSVCIKVAKIVWSDVVSGDSLHVLQKMLSTGEDFNSILFDPAVKPYVKKKLKHFICFILKQCCLSHSKELSVEILEVSVTIFNTLWSSDILSLLRKRGNTTFIGNPLNDSDASGDRLSWDTIHIRDWTYLCFCVSSCLVLHQDYRDKTILFLLRLDDCLKELLDRQTSSLFPWLPDVYGDHDGVWIDVMILLIKIFPLKGEQFSMLTEEMWNQHHMHFLQFVKTLGYDHLVLIDLLTSPETNCLTYLLKYLKFLLSTWEYFTTLTSKHLKQNVAFDDCSCDTLDQKVNDRDSIKDTGSFDENSEEMLEKATSAENDVIAKQNVADACRMISYHQSSCNSVSETNGDKNYSKLLATSSLMLIADAYDDDDDDEEEEEEDNDLNENDFDDVNDRVSKECNVNSNAVMNIELFTDKNKTYSDIAKPVTESDLGEINPIEYNANISDKGNEAYFDNSTERKEYEINHAEVSDNVYDSVKQSIFDKQDIQDLVTGTDGTVADESVQDKIMGMLIRTRLQLEKLTESDLMKYNPSVLINLIALVEELYEQD